MHLRNPRKTFKPSRNCPRSSSVHTEGLLIRIYLKETQARSSDRDQKKSGKNVVLHSLAVRLPEVVEDDLNACKLVWVVAQEEEAIVIIQMFTQQIHHCINYYLNDIALFDQLSGLQEDREYEDRGGCYGTANIILSQILAIYHTYTTMTQHIHRCYYGKQHLPK